MRFEAIAQLYSKHSRSRVASLLECPIQKIGWETMKPLDTKIALVTGASRGIGKAVAQRLARDGATVAVHYGTNEAAALETVATIEAEGGIAFPLGVELGVPGDAEALWDAFDATGLGAVDIIVNNAGTVVYSTIEGVSEKDFDAVFAVNAKAPFFVIQQGLRRLRDGGRIINISSAAARVATPLTIAYSMTKAALNGLSRTLALELGNRGITVNSVEPGIVETDIAAWLADDRMHAQAAAWSAFHRVGQPHDIADVVAFLASHDARWVTGQYIDATGGLALGPTVDVGSLR
ncbi:SDR family oxidoreductase [Nocardia sp. bgisy134]|uniref:SDR family oxidoreductase n=1 Tax=Nocardia sp. bgisy134 TaxID=3413789 RepID=UPI003D74D116